jgi:hypothetical protein
MLIYSLLRCCRIPQIIFNVLKDADPRRPAFSTRYVVGMTLTRLLVPLYLYGGWGDNYLHMRPNLLFCVVLAAYTLMQMGVILAQQKFGAILPWMAPLVPAKVPTQLFCYPSSKRVYISSSMLHCITLPAHATLCCTRHSGCL